jgi:hypothetical protein
MLVRSIPYVNLELLKHSYLIDLNNQTLSDIVYLSKHDDYKVGNNETLGGNQGCNVNRHLVMMGYIP